MGAESDFQSICFVAHTQQVVSHPTPCLFDLLDENVSTIVSYTHIPICMCCCIGAVRACACACMCVCVCVCIPAAPCELL